MEKKTIGRKFLTAVLNVGENRKIMWMMCVLLCVLNGYCVYVLYCNFFYEFFELLNYSGIDINIQSIDVHRTVGEEGANTSEVKSGGKSVSEAKDDDEEEESEWVRSCDKVAYACGKGIMFCASLYMQFVGTELIAQYIKEWLEIILKK
jgi:hypothetical protein